MAFNYRANNAKEIVLKKKAFSLPASQIYSYISKTYGETIILDPTTNFSDVKIPRAVEKKIGIAALKQTLAKSIDTKGMKIQYGNGSGSGGSSINAAETAKQENATRFFCERYVETGKFPRDSEIEKIYSQYDDGWANTFQMQATALKKWLGSNKGYEYSRDNGIMPFIEKIALQKCGVRTKDSWNPADIYLGRKSKLKQIQDKVTNIGNMKSEPAAKLDALNEYMRELFKKRDLIGISLKKLGKSVSLEETNVAGNKVEKITMVKGSLRCDLDLKANGEFNTGEMAFALKVGNAVVNVQVRAFSGGERESTQMDMTGSGAAAKLGKVSSREALDPFLTKYGLKRRMGTAIPKVGQFSKQDIDFYLTEQKKLARYTIAGNKVYFGKVKWETSFSKARKLEVGNNRTASQLSSKLQCFQWIEILNTLQTKGVLNDFLNVAYYGAKKQYASAGPFLKIS